MKPSRPLLTAVLCSTLLAPRILALDCNGNGVEDAVDLESPTARLDVTERHEVGLTPRSIVAADFDNDGDTDIVAANRHSSSFALLRNRGAGTFEAPVFHPLLNPAWITAADFDGDGHVDIASVSALSTDVIIVRGREGVEFDEPRPYTLKTSGWDFIASGDVDADGAIDLVVVNRFFHNVAVLFGDGLGGIDTHVVVEFPHGEIPRTVALADLDGDGDTDLALAAESISTSAQVRLPGSVIWVPNNGRRGFNSPRSVANGGSPRYLVAADFDADGDSDLAWVDLDSGLFVAENGGRGLFERRMITDGDGVELGQLVAADLDADQRLDLVFLASSGEARAALNRDDGSFELIPDGFVGMLGVTPQAIVAVDLDGDGDDDIATTNFDSEGGGNEVVVLRTENVPVSADRNANGVPDECEDGDCIVSGIRFERTAVVPVIQTSPRAVIGDFDGDGDNDIGLGMTERRGAIWLRNDGTGRFGASSVERPEGSRLAAADLDRDGQDDLLTLVRDEARVLYGGRDGDFSPLWRYAFAQDSRPEALAIADFDGDRLPDIAAATRRPDPDCHAYQISLLLQDRPRVFRDSSTVFDSCDIGSIAALTAGDFDDDGQQDLAAAVGRGENSFIAVFRGRGDGSFDARRELHLGKLRARALVAIDIDRDGDDDLVLAGNNFDIAGNAANGVRVFTNAGDGTLEETAFHHTAERLDELHVAHVNLDGSPDIVAVPELGGGVLIFANFGDGELSTPSRAPLPGGALTAAVGNLDRDGEDEIAGVENVFFTSANIVVLDRVESRGAADCDGNGALDTCEIARGESDDCDWGGVPDVCELALSGSDENGNGLLDACESSVVRLGIEGPDALRTGRPGATVSAVYDCVMTPVPNAFERGVQGWSISVAAAGARIVEATVQGTVGADAVDGPPGLMRGGFERTELASNDEYEGAVSAVVLSATQPITLPVDEPSLICKLTVEATTPDPAAARNASVFYGDGLRGSGQSVTNLVTIDGSSVVPFLGRKEILVSSASEDFRRGDANADGRVDISDSLAILGFLFLGGGSPVCLKAADTDDSGTLDITDGAAVNTFLFLGGPAPPAPGPFECGADPTTDDLGCFESPGCR